MSKEVSSPVQVSEFPLLEESYAKLPTFAERIPSSVRIHIYSWMFMTSHDFCEHAPIDEIPAVLRNFDVEHKFGKERRSPKLVVKDGRTLPIFVFMAKGINERSCSCCWPCRLCGLSICMNPSDLTCMPCQPLEKSDEKLIDPFWEPYDLLIYFITKQRPLDSTFHPNKYRKHFSGRAEDLFYENALSYPNGIQILDYLHSKIDLGETWAKKKAALK